MGRWNYRDPQPGRGCGWGKGCMPATDTVTRADAAHLLRRAGYGGSEAEITGLTGQSRRACVDAVMGFRSTDAIPVGPDVGVPGFVNKASQWDAHSDVISWWVDRMATLANPTTTPSPAPAAAADLPIYERLAFFWHDHFACAQDKVSDLPVMWDQIRTLRRMAMGSFDALVRAIAVHPAMLVHLDNQHNTVSEPQENFGRELMELYTCGVGEFTEADVVAMTSAWTGHNTVGWDNVNNFWDSTYVYDEGAHDFGTKTLFGYSANWNGIAQNSSERDTVNELVHGVRQGATARRIARKLFAWFAHREPSEATVQGLADVFVANGMSIGPLLRAILEHDEFWSATSRWGLVKNPTDYIATLVRRTGADAWDLGLHWRMYNMGQVPLDPPSVAGWGSDLGWLSTASAWGRGRFAGGMRWSATNTETGLGLLANLQDSGATNGVQTLLDLFGLEEVSSQTRSRLEEWFDEAHATDRWSIPPQGFMLGALTPEFQVY